MSGKVIKAFVYLDDVIVVFEFDFKNLRYVVNVYEGDLQNWVGVADEGEIDEFALEEGIYVVNFKLENEFTIDIENKEVYLDGQKYENVYWEVWEEWEF